MSPYALQKLVGEQYCRLVSQLYGLQTVSLRYFNVYGPRQTTTTDGPYATVVGIFLEQKSRGLSLPVVPDGTPSGGTSPMSLTSSGRISRPWSRIGLARAR